MKKMICLKDNYKAMSEEAAAVLESVVRKNPAAVIVLATGHSPLLTYRLFVEHVKKTGLDVSGVTFVKLDEWLGLSPADEATCEYFIRKEVLEPLQIREEKYLHFFSQTEDAKAECERVEQAYERLPQVDLVILGIGMNGHLGLNEPGETLSAGAHVIELDEKTKGHEMLSHTKQPVGKGITLGMKNLFRGEEILLLADGKEKEKGLSGYLSNEITTQIPVSLLKLHPACRCIVNRESFPALEGLEEFC